MTISSTDAQTIAKAVWNLAIKSSQTGNTYQAKGFLTSASQASDLIPGVIKALNTLQGAGNDNAAMQAIVVQALQSTAGQAAIRAAFTS